MKFLPLPVHGAGLLELSPFTDDRGSFTRTFCADELAAFGLDGRMAQCNESHSTAALTLRGLHHMARPVRETKTIRVLHGAIWDVVVDLRQSSPTFLRWAGAELRAGDLRAMHVPDGCAHGFLTLVPGTVVTYVLSEPYRAEFYRGVRWNDPAFGIRWPETPRVIHPRDANFPDFDRERDAT
jgi:dTDP-4-dehydrorhamnose 3,5-epimerase